MKLGIEVGEICGRDGCRGEISDFWHVMNEIENDEMSCTCFIHAPCGKHDPIYSGRNMCPVCDWDSED